MQALSALFRLFDDPEAMAALAPELAATTPSTPAAIDAIALATRGWTTVALATQSAVALESAVARVVSTGLPAVAVYAFPPLWAIGQALAARLGAIAPYVLVEDFWAWRVPPGGRGWPAHRGLATRLDRDRPELVNAWLALSDVEVDRACMHFVALDDDPDYPDALERTGEHGGVPAPIAAGDALLFQGNVLHWGGANTRAPRTSASFSFCRRDALGKLGLRPVEGIPDFALRTAMIAGQIGVYGRGRPDVSAAVEGWANAVMKLTNPADGKLR